MASYTEQEWEVQNNLGSMDNCRGGGGGGGGDFQMWRPLRWRWTGWVRAWILSGCGPLNNWISPIWPKLLMKLFNNFFKQSLHCFYPVQPIHAYTVEWTGLHTIVKESCGERSFGEGLCVTVPVEKGPLEKDSVLLSLLLCMSTVTLSVTQVMATSCETVDLCLILLIILWL